MAHTLSITAPTNPPKCLARPNITVNVGIGWDENIQPSAHAVFLVRFRLVDDNNLDLVVNQDVGVTFNVTPATSTTFNLAADLVDVTVIANLIERLPPFGPEVAHAGDTGGKYSMKANC